jgi:LmbE family N-acetylglucosaminyl deacetylase
MTRSRVTRRHFVCATAAIVAAGRSAATTGAAVGSAAPAKQRWLIIGAHPDDEAKAVPLILKERQPGDDVVVMIMRLCGEGKLYDRPKWTREEAIATRKYEMEQAAKFMKAELRWWLPPHPDNVNIVRTPETVAKMLGILREVQPTRIIANWHEDFHPDHIGVGETVGAAVKQLQTPGGMPVYWFGTPGRAHVQKNFVPNHFVDISATPDLATVLWGRFVHRCQATYTAILEHMTYYREHGKKMGVEYAAGYVLERV